MTMKQKCFLLFGLMCLLSAFKSDNSVPTIFMIGDSTMANKVLTGGNPERGWGQMLPGFLSDEIRVDNHAVNGRSSKSFIDEGRWDKVLGLMKKGDYLFIQFGHNDEKADPKRSRHTATTLRPHRLRHRTQKWLCAEEFRKQCHIAPGNHSCTRTRPS